MDLKSMLNESHPHRGPPPPRPSISTHTPHSSYDARTEQTPSSDMTSARPTPYGHPSHVGESRGPGGSGSGSGSYFATQSPHHIHSASASTPSAGPSSVYAPSPSSHSGKGYTPRDHGGAIPGYPSTINVQHNAPFVSPTPSANHISPPVAYTAYLNNNAQNHHSHQNSNSYSQNYHQFQSPPPPQANGLPLSQVRHISPANQFSNQPATPLGPPINYPRASPQHQRPSSQGQPIYQESHLRRASQTSVGSHSSRDLNRSDPYQPPPAIQHAPPVPHTRRESTQGSYHSYGYQDRDRSESVSPKTIPRPTPQREYSTGSQGHSYPPSHSGSVASQTPYHQSTPVQANHRHSISMSSPAEPSPGPQPVQSKASIPFASDRVDSSEQRPDMKPSPAPVQQSSAPSPAENTPRETQLAKVEPAPNHLKRRASNMSEIKPPPPQKRPRHETPIWAMSARTGSDGRIRPLNLNAKPNRQSRPKPEPRPPQRSNGPEPRKQEAPQSLQSHFEPSIQGLRPYESLAREISNWVMGLMSDYPPPPGAHYEIEAKIGRIMDKATDRRLNLPYLESEVLLNTSKNGGLDTKFSSNMTRHHHQALNEYLNSLVKQNMQELHTNPRKAAISYSHPKENDEFFSLDEQGKADLDPQLQQWIRDHPSPEFREKFVRRNEFKVRRTVDKVTGQPKAQIIKIRIADKDIYNPQHHFDYRISVSLETPWQGRVEHLTPVPGSHGRNKDRMSYRHQMYQVDLTQVSHADNPQQFEHELEVELATEVVRQDLDALLRQRESDYEVHITGLLDNARLLCRKGSIALARDMVW